MRRLALLTSMVVLIALALTSNVQAAFNVEDFKLSFDNENGSPATQAGSHPFAVTSSLSFSSILTPEGGDALDEQPKNLDVRLPEGLVGNPGAVPRCSNADFININLATKIPNCSNSLADIRFPHFCSAPTRPENGPATVSLPSTICNGNAASGFGAGPLMTRARSFASTVDV